MTDIDHDATREVDWLSGSCMMIRREIFSRAGKFDEHYFLFNEDVDLCHTMKSLGLKVIYYPSCRIHHRISSSNSRLDPGTIIKRHRGMSYYYRKHFRHQSAVSFLIDFLVALRCVSQLSLNIFR
jgi:GT2 family glycosyltransferase